MGQATDSAVLHSSSSQRRIHPTVGRLVLHRPSPGGARKILCRTFSVTVCIVAAINGFWLEQKGDFLPTWPFVKLCAAVVGREPGFTLRRGRIVILKERRRRSEKCSNWLLYFFKSVFLLWCWIKYNQLICCLSPVNILSNCWKKKAQVSDSGQNKASHWTLNNPSSVYWEANVSVTSLDQMLLSLFLPVFLFFSPILRFPTVGQFVCCFNYWRDQCS